MAEQTRPESSAFSGRTGGLSKREWFVGQALAAAATALISRNLTMSPAMVANFAVELADKTIDRLNDGKPLPADRNYTVGH